MHGSWHTGPVKRRRKKIRQRPVVLKKGNRVQLKNGYCFRVVYPKKVSGVKYFSWKMLLRPVRYSGRRIRSDWNGYSGFWCMRVSGRQRASEIKSCLSANGNHCCKKTCSQTGHPVKGAVYSLYAAQDLYSGGILMNKKDTVVAK